MPRWCEKARNPTRHPESDRISDLVSRTKSHYVATQKRASAASTASPVISKEMALKTALRYASLDTLYEHTDLVGGCLIWRGAKKRGYGVIAVTPRPIRYELVHRRVWRLAGHELPEGFDVHHLCGNRGCVRVEHLDAMPHSEHMRLHAQRGATCQRGHREWYVSPNGRRQCRACKREWYRAGGGHRG